MKFVSVTDGHTDGLTNGRTDRREVGNSDVDLCIYNRFAHKVHPDWDTIRPLSLCESHILFK